MAAAATATATAAAVGSSFSPSLHTTLKCRRSNLLHLGIISPQHSRLSAALSQSCTAATSEPALIGGAALHKRRVIRVTAAVAQEEVASLTTEEEAGGGAAADEADDGVTAAAAETVNEVEPAAAAVVGGGDQVDQGEEVSAVSTKLYFGNLPYSVDSAQLAGIIQDYGSPELIEVLYDRETGRSRGFAFVTMSSVEDCNAVIQNLDGSQYMGRILRVNFSDKPKPKEPLYPETEYKLFVGNLSWSVTSESLIKAFQEYGNVVGARVLYDGETGRSRGYGFVCYNTKAEMETALESLNGVELEGRAMRVSLAEGKRS
ncbi:Splicing factor-like protein [Parasponia andersonii]|uniref:Splicing factor-like protein n=1 Tax=Parasponia andersonii TaxID=3476 RepID=A0A2P5ANN3_PARAD|nr:Splicing factor-like protein [Parasponia andersonii]